MTTNHIQRSCSCQVQRFQNITRGTVWNWNLGDWHVSAIKRYLPFSQSAVGFRFSTNTKWAAWLQDFTPTRCNDRNERTREWRLGCNQYPSNHRTATSIHPNSHPSAGGQARKRNKASPLKSLSISKIKRRELWLGIKYGGPPMTKRSTIWATPLCATTGSSSHNHKKSCQLAVTNICECNSGRHPKGITPG